MTPSPAAEMREAAAKLCESVAILHEKLLDDDDAYIDDINQFHGGISMARDLAAAIRALPLTEPKEG